MAESRVIPYQTVIGQIDSTGLRRPFVLVFAKADGTLREIVCVKKNKQVNRRTEKSAGGSAFRYSLSEKHMLMLLDLNIPTTIVEVPGVGTLTKLKYTPDLDQLADRLHDRNDRQIDYKRCSSKSVKMSSIFAFNGQEVHS